MQNYEMQGAIGYVGQGSIQCTRDGLGCGYAEHGRVRLTHDEPSMH